MGASTTNGVAYSDLALLYFPIDNAGALEEIDDKGNVINKNEIAPPTKSSGDAFFPKLAGAYNQNLIIAVVLVAGYFAYKKFKK